MPTDDLARLRSWANGTQRQVKALEAYAQQTAQHLQSIDGQLQMLAQATSDLQARSEVPAVDPTSIDALIGYKPTPEQQAELWKALAAFQATLAPIPKNRGAAFTTRQREDGRGGQEVSYGYIDLGAVMAAAYKAGEHGISIVCMRLPPLKPGDISVVALALHAGGGAISSGPWSAPPADSALASQHQRVSMALTTARRVLVQMLLGIAPEEEDGGGAERPGGTPARRSTSRSAPRAAAPAQVAAAPGPSGPPPGWLSTADRKALEAELADPAITPERFEEIEQRLAAAKAAATPRRVAGTTTTP